MPTSIQITGFSLSADGDHPLICQSCETRECLKSPWVPQDAIEDWEILWQQQYLRNGSLGSPRPAPFNLVRHLQIIESEKMAQFFRSNCAGK